MTKRLGVDIGGVIAERADNKKSLSFFRNDYLNTTAVEDAFISISLLSREVFGAGNVYLVSKCGPITENKTINWLSYHNFHTITGIKSENVKFCRRREEKAPICEELGITHFIDDRLEVLSYLETVRHKYLFNPEENEVAKNKQYLSQVKIVRNWREIMQDLLTSSINQKVY